MWEDADEEGAFGSAAPTCAGAGWNAVNCPFRNAADLSACGDGCRGRVMQITENYPAQLGCTNELLSPHDAPSAITCAGEPSGNRDLYWQKQRVIPQSGRGIREPQAT